MKMFDLAAKIKKLDDEIVSDRKRIDLIQKSVNRKSKERDQLLIELNKEHFDDFEWLLLNPTLPGVHEATDKKIKEIFGGDYKGVSAHAGYFHDDKYKPIQKCIEFIFTAWGDTEENILEAKRNIRLFVDRFLHVLKPVMEVSSRWNDDIPETNVIPFRVCSLESGIVYVAYDPEKKEWFDVELSYGKSNARRKFKDFEECLDFIVHMNLKRDGDDADDGDDDE